MADEAGFAGMSFDLTLADLFTAYRFGLFPVNDPDEPICWWSPDPRWVLYPADVVRSKSMRRLLRQDPWEVRVDTGFTKVMKSCAAGLTRQKTGTWIDKRILSAYFRLFEMGHAHSFEVYDNGKLIGGFYGVVTGTVFSGESMFAHVSNASKYALIRACDFFTALGITLIDCQMHSHHLESLGARPLTRLEYLDYIKRHGFLSETLHGPWSQKYRDWWSSIQLCDL